MPTAREMARRLQAAFTEDQAEVLAEVIADAYNDLVKTGDFNELKEIVRDLAQAQARTEARVEELAQAQARTEAQVEELAQAQVRTEQTVAKLARGMDAMRQEVGGLSRTMGYALENEAYRALPDFLLREHGLRVTDRFVRTEIEGEEINFLAHAERADGTPVLIVGESKARLDERRRTRQQAERVLGALQEKVAAAAGAYPDVEIVPLLVTHYARPAFLEAAQAQGVIVAQSFQWS